jgi:hypothetical protein
VPYTDGHTRDVKTLHILCDRRAEFLKSFIRAQLKFPGYMH